jgi:hypothetical protein
MGPQVYIIYVWRASAAGLRIAFFGGALSLSVAHTALTVCLFSSSSFFSFLFLFLFFLCVLQSTSSGANPSIRETARPATVLRTRQPSTGCWPFVTLRQPLITHVEKRRKQKTDTLRLDAGDLSRLYKFYT